MVPAKEIAAEFQPILDVLEQAPRISAATVEAARAMWGSFILGEAEPLLAVTDLTVPGAEGQLPARLYVPQQNPAGIIFFAHGGGWVLGDLATHDIAVRGLAMRSGCAVLAIEYRLAPETPFPGGLEDCYAALGWLAANRGDLGLAGKPILVGGDSAGGNLAAALAILCRDRSGPAIAGQVLIYPVTDGRRKTRSYEERGAGGLLSAADMTWFWHHYAPGDLACAPLASVILTPSLAGLAPAVVVTAEYDPLRDEGRDYAAALKTAGVRCTELHYPDLPHGFITFYQTAKSAGVAMTDIAREARAMAEQGAVA